MATYHLHKWSVCMDPNDPYSAPEVSYKCLIGYRGDEELPVRTSYISKINGREITTASGSVYILEDISPDYLNWMKDMGIVYNPESPVKFK